MTTPRSLKSYGELQRIRSSGASEERVADTRWRWLDDVVRCKSSLGSSWSRRDSNCSRRYSNRSRRSSNRSGWGSTEAAGTVIGEAGAGATNQGEDVPLVVTAVLARPVLERPP